MRFQKIMLTEPHVVDLLKEDGAFVFRANGPVEVYVPSVKDNTTAASEEVIAAMVLIWVLTNRRVYEEMVVRFSANLNSNR